jgi:hypothetical protein
VTSEVNSEIYEHFHADKFYASSCMAVACAALEG